MLIENLQNNLILKCKITCFKKDYTKIEKENKISINVLGYENKLLYCIYTSKRTKVLECHRKSCLVINHTKSFHYLKKVHMINFEILKN